VNRARRWPPPQPLESLSSWLHRLARLYRMPVKDLLGNLDVDLPADLDYDPPQVLLAELAQRTGMGLGQVRAMTLAGSEMWLLDTVYLQRPNAQDVFETYVRDNSVLLAPGDAGPNDLSRWAHWAGPWQPRRPVERICPVCAADPDRGVALMWRLPLMVSCVEHRCRLEDTRTVRPAIALNILEPVPVDEPTAALDRYTYPALTVGRVDLPGRSVHAGVWFRLLRSLLDEVSLALTTRSAHGRTILERIWHTTGHPPRGGLNVWQPYENLPWTTQAVLLQAAAVALHLAADGRITARGVHAGALRPTVHHDVYDGDQPEPPDPLATAWQQAVAALEAAAVRARTDPAVARQLLALITLGCRTHARFEQERAYLIGLGIPTENLSTPTELGRTDLA